MIKNMEGDILTSGQVIVSTLGTMARRAREVVYDNPSPTGIIIDEATSHRACGFGLLFLMHKDLF